MSVIHGAVFGTAAIGLPIFLAYNMNRLVAAQMNNGDRLSKLCGALERKDLSSEKRDVIRRIYAGEIYLKTGQSSTLQVEDGTTRTYAPSPTDVALRQAVHNLNVVTTHLWWTAGFWGSYLVMAGLIGILRPLGRGRHSAGPMLSASGNE